MITEGTREFFANKLDKALDVVKSGQAIQRNLQPSDLSGTILWLVADTSASSPDRRSLSMAAR